MYTFNLNTQFNYGCFNGYCLKEILFADASYIIWSINNIQKFRFEQQSVFEFLQSELTDEQVVEGLKIFHDVMRNVGTRYAGEIVLVAYRPDIPLTPDKIIRLREIFHQQFTDILECYTNSFKYRAVQSETLNDSLVDDFDDYNDLDLYEDPDDRDYRESRSYSRYGGSYASYEAGFSDEEIDTIFDGDPDMYWNID
jgi:hypothetical protein